MIMKTGVYWQKNNHHCNSGKYMYHINRRTHIYKHTVNFTTVCRLKIYG